MIVWIFTNLFLQSRRCPLFLLFFSCKSRSRQGSGSCTRIRAECKLSLYRVRFQCAWRVPELSRFPLFPPFAAIRATRYPSA